MSGSTDLVDATARQHVTDRLDRTLFVEAGAGSGKTRSLVDRVVATVLNPDSAIPLRHIAAVTFTEKAGAELRDRLRDTFEQHAAGADDRAGRAAEALDDLDAAAIGTLHSFAQRILGEHPIEASLPPLIDVLDEVGSGVAFDARWVALRAELLDDAATAPALLLAMAAGMKLDDLRSMARALTDDWDLLEPRVLASEPGELPPMDVADLVLEAQRLAALADHCGDDGDLFLPNLGVLAEWADRLDTAPDDPARLAILVQASALKWGYGRQANWTGYGLNQIKDECKQFVARVGALRTQVLDTALRQLARRVAEATLDAARARRDEGRLEFHDLLVLARDLLRHATHGVAVRGALQQRYQRLLLDEFQDTDPIQIELAARIAGGGEADAADWREIDIPPGSLFVVGDPKQSIYRFRRADIATYLEAQGRIGGGTVLATNFRTTAPVLGWINHVFSGLITAAPGSQPEYGPLAEHRPAAPSGPAVTLLGADAHQDRPNADEVRTREAADVVAAVRTALVERWQVGGTEGSWRDVALSDIAILVPARTSLPHLENALDAAGIPYRAEASSLVYRSREIRDLLMAVRAVDDPSDSLALVTALRNPLFGCGDDDLLSWHTAGGRWNILAPIPDTVPSVHPVREAVTYLRRLHNDKAWLAPSEVLGRLVDDRRMLEVAADGPRTRDVWRRLRFVVDQARAWSEVEHGGLRGYLGWAQRQGDEAARVAEAVLPETDTEMLRIMTIHAAKGLEFPVVILSGMSSQPGGARSGVEVLWPPTGGCEFKLRKDLQTGDFEVAKPIDEQMDYHERLRLLYVACTRARDHLVVSLHRKARTQPPSSDRQLTNAELIANGSSDAPAQTELAEQPETEVDVAAGPQPVEPPPPYAEWLEGNLGVRADRKSVV